MLIYRPTTELGQCSSPYAANFKPNIERSKLAKDSASAKLSFVTGNYINNITKDRVYNARDAM